jgi:hypothetical protein
MQNNGYALNNLVQTLWRTHASLDSKTADVLPSLLQQRNEVVDGQHDVTNQVVFGHANVSDGNTETENLLQLELDGRSDFVDFAGKIFVVGDWSWELSGCTSNFVSNHCSYTLRMIKIYVHTFRQTRAQNTGDKLDQRVRGDESIVLSSELLDQLLVLVELLEIVGAHGIESVVLGTIDIMLISENAVVIPPC